MAVSSNWDRSGGEALGMGNYREELSLRLRQYKLGFDAWGLLLFLAIMAPNIVWFSVPAPNDILRADSATEVIDTVASVCQVLMVVALCVLANREKGRLHATPLIVFVVVCCLLYYASWVGYYAGCANARVILGLTIPPCLAFVFFAIGRKNMVAVILALVFLACHLTYGVVNFIM